MHKMRQEKFRLSRSSNSVSDYFTKYYEIISDRFLTENHEIYYQITFPKETLTLVCEKENSDLEFPFSAKKPEDIAENIRYFLNETIKEKIEANKNKLLNSLYAHFTPIIGQDEEKLKNFKNALKYIETRIKETNEYDSFYKIIFPSSLKQYPILAVSMLIFNKNFIIPFKESNQDLEKLKFEIDSPLGIIYLTVDIKDFEYDEPKKTNFSASLLQFMQQFHQIEEILAKDSELEITKNFNLHESWLSFLNIYNTIYKQVRRLHSGLSAHPDLTFFQNHAENGININDCFGNIQFHLKLALKQSQSQPSSFVNSSPMDPLFPRRYT